MSGSGLPPEEQGDPFDPRVPGKARTIYTIVAVIVVASLILGLAGFAVWDRLF